MSRQNSAGSSTLIILGVIGWLVYGDWQGGLAVIGWTVISVMCSCLGIVPVLGTIGYLVLGHFYATPVLAILGIEATWLTAAIYWAFGGFTIVWSVFAVYILSSVRRNRRMNSKNRRF